jgi:hypothetical protein
MSRFSLAAVVILGLTGCHLIDQTDFDRQPPPQAARPIPDPETRPALVTIEYAKANPDFKTALPPVIQVAETRRPGVLYDVVSFVGSQAEAATGRARAAEVMTAIEAAGVVPARIQLGVTIEPGRKIQQVRVYLR